MSNPERPRIPEELQGLELSTTPETFERRCPFPPIPELAERDDIEVVEHEFGKGWLHEYLDRQAKPFEIPHTVVGGGTIVEFAYRVPEIEYVSPEGNRLRLGSLLPENRQESFARRDGRLAPRLFYQRFEREGAVIYGKVTRRLEADASGQVTEKIEPFFESPTALFELLHEVGHARQEPNRAEQRAPSETGEDSWIIQRERDAWAYAVRVVREQRDKGVDLAPGLDTVEKLLTSVHVALGTYEEGVSDRDACRHTSRAAEASSAL